MPPFLPYLNLCCVNSPCVQAAGESQQSDPLEQESQVVVNHWTKGTLCWFCYFVVFGFVFGCCFREPSVVTHTGFTWDVFLSVALACYVRVPCAPLVPLEARRSNQILPTSVMMALNCHVGSWVLCKSSECLKSPSRILSSFRLFLESHVAQTGP